MTVWNHDVDRITAGRIARGEQNSVIVWDKGNDFQRGDSLKLSGDGEWVNGRWEVTHVIKNQNGIENGYAVLCLRAPDADYWNNRAKTVEAENRRLTRSNASLRGQITKLRRRWVSNAGESGAR